MGIDVVVADDADRRARELAAEVGASLVRTPAEVEELLDRWAAAAQARDARGAATEARLLAAALAPEDAYRCVTSLLDQLTAARADADRAADTAVLPASVDPDEARVAEADVRRASDALHHTQSRLGARPDEDDDSAARSVAAARAVLEGAKAQTPNAGMRLGYVAAGNGIALLLVGLEAPAMLVVAVLGLVVIAGLQQLVVARRTVKAAGRPLEAALHRRRRETAEDLGMALTDLDDWHRRAAAVVAAKEEVAAALVRWHALVGANVEPDQLDELIAATATPAWRAQSATTVTWPEHEWAAALARLELDPCPAGAPDRALAQLERHLAEPGSRDRAERRLQSLLEGRELGDLLADVAAYEGVPVLSGNPVVLADPLRGLEPARRNELLRRLGECDDVAITLVTADAEAEAWLTGPGRARG